MKDKRGHMRGHCMECECEEYEKEENSHKCDFCGHNPVQHKLIEGESCTVSDATMVTCFVDGDIMFRSEISQGFSS
jgi:hypothetical protein